MENNQNISPNLIEFAKIIDGMYDLYERKNRCYGNSFSETWEKLGPVSGVTRLRDKVNRATNLVTGAQGDFESLEDTFIDLANYAIMCVIELHKDTPEYGKVGIHDDVAAKHTPKTILCENK